MGLSRRGHAPDRGQVIEERRDAAGANGERVLLFVKQNEVPYPKSIGLFSALTEVATTANVGDLF